MGKGGVVYVNEVGGALLRPRCCQWGGWSLCAKEAGLRFGGRGLGGPISLQAPEK